MAIIRPPMPEDGFFIGRRAWVRDPRTSYKAKGLLMAILSHSESWDLTTEQLVAQSDDGKAAVNTGLQELERVGYLVRIRKRRDLTEDEKRRAGTFCGYDLQLVEPPPPDESGRGKGVTRRQPKRGAASRSRKSDPGPDQGFLDPTTNRFSSSGESSAGFSSAGESATKETQGLGDHSLEVDLEEDQTPPTPPDPKPALEPAGEVNPGGDSISTEQNPTPEQIRALAGQLQSGHVGQGWKYALQRTEQAWTDLRGRHPWPVFEHALLQLAHGRHGPTMSPRRVTESGPWWDAAYKAYRSSAASMPSPRGSAVAECSRCDPHGWVLEPGSSQVPMDPATRCTHEREMAGAAS